MRGEAPKRRKGLAMTDALPANNQAPISVYRRGSKKKLTIAKGVGVLKPLAAGQAKINANWRAAEAAALPSGLKRKPRSMERLGIPKVAKSMPEPANLLDMGNFILKGKSRGTDGKFR